jgi:hypothetical protein
MHIPVDFEGGSLASTCWTDSPGDLDVNGHAPSLQHLPITPRAYDLLLDELAQLRRDITVMAGQGLEEGILRLPVARAARRLETLELVVGGARITNAPRVAIGRRVELRDGEGNKLWCSIVVPGDGDPRHGCVSADSPLGIALLGAEVGSTVVVRAPSGSWSATVLSVD